MEKNLLKRKLINFLAEFDLKIKTKMTNICDKTGQYNVPSELFQKRTSRKNRALISWEEVRNNGLTIEQLSTYEGGIVVELINNDFFDESNKNNNVFVELLNRIGSNESVSTIISFRKEAGSSSSALAREAFKKFLDNTVINYNGRTIEINESNYEEYAINQIKQGGTGNEKWSGFLFVSIKGGQQDTIETHKNQNLTLFNPACEYASSEVCLDIDLVLGYFAMKSINYNELDNASKLKYDLILKDLEIIMQEIHYDVDKHLTTLLDYCLNHISLKMYDNELTDPIQVKKIEITSFGISSNAANSVDLTHNEAVNKGKYYWDEKRKCVLGPARPTNLFWSYHLSNMMQQNFELDEYFDYEEERHKLREILSNKRNESSDVI